MDFSNYIQEYEDSYSILEQDAGFILLDNLQDRCVYLGVFSHFVPSPESWIMFLEQDRSQLSRQDLIN